jgi:hypothetical protein
MSTSAAATAYRTHAVEPVNIPGDDFEKGMRTIARLLRGSVPSIGARDTDFLYDLAREEVRYPMPTVRKICALSRRSTNTMAHGAFAELIRRECTPDDAAPGVTIAFDLETRKTGPADVAQRDFEKNRNPITYARAKAALTEQSEAAQHALLALVRWGRQNGLEGVPAVGT